MFIISPCLPVFDWRHLDDWSLYPGNHLQYLLSAVLPPPEIPQDISQVTTYNAHVSSQLTDPDVPQAVAAAGAGGHGAPGHLADHLLGADPRPGSGQSVSLHHQVVTAASPGQCGPRSQGYWWSNDPRARWWCLSTWQYPWLWRDICLLFTLFTLWGTGHDSEIHLINIKLSSYVILFFSQIQIKRSDPGSSGCVVFLDLHQSKLFHDFNNIFIIWQWQRYWHW